MNKALEHTEMRDMQGKTIKFAGHLWIVLRTFIKNESEYVELRRKYWTAEFRKYGAVTMQIEVKTSNLD